MNTDVKGASEASPDLGDEKDFNKNEQDSMVTMEEERASYGTMDTKQSLKRFCLRVPDGKLVYAHVASEPDSLMEQRPAERGGFFGFGGGRAPNALENYFRAIDFIEQNIDFPIHVDYEAIDSFRMHRHLYYAFAVFLFLLNGSSSYLAYRRKDTVAENLTKTNKGDDASDFLSFFILMSIFADMFFYIAAFIISSFCY